MRRIVGVVTVLALLACGNSQRQTVATTIEFRLAETEPAEGLEEMTIRGADERFFLHDEVLISNADIASASAVVQHGHPAVELIFTESGRKKVARVTAENVNRRIGITVDGRLVSAPIVKAPIREGRALIEGTFSEKEAQRIAEGIMMGRETGEATRRFLLTDARRFMDSYMRALRTGEKTKISSFWSRRSLQREGFDYMHLWIGACIPISAWPDLFDEGNCSYEIRNVRPQSDYYIIDFQWILEDTAHLNEKRQVHDMRHYIIREDGKWVLMNPIDLLTRDWHTFETDRLLFHYPPTVDIEDYVAHIEYMDVECKRIVETLGVKQEHKIGFYKARTPRECGELLNWPPGNGYCARALPFRPDAPRWFHIVISMSFVNPHEVVHLFAPLAKLYSVTVAFDEGIAVALGGTTFQTPEFCLIHTRNVIDHPSYVPLKTLLTDEDAFWRNTSITYQEAGAFIRFLLDRFGLRKLQELCNYPGAAEQLDGAIQAVYGYGIDELEGLWREYVLQFDVPDIGHTIPESPQIVFSMADPAGDDTGDGDYAYPPDDRFEEGAFDLTAFEVFKDSGRAYFRLRFRNLIDPVAYDFAEERFAPGAVIAINTGNEGERQMQKHFDGVELEEGQGYDVKLTVGFGVCLSNSLGKVYYSTGDIRGVISKKEENKIEFSFPIRFVGEPHADWRYFVGVGLMGDRAMHFFGGPMPVQKDHRMFISGGDYDHGNPAFIDILLPEDRDQVEVLSDYDPLEGRAAIVPMVTQR